MTDEQRRGDESSDKRGAALAKQERALQRAAQQASQTADREQIHHAARAPRAAKLKGLQHRGQPDATGTAAWESEIPGNRRQARSVSPAGSPSNTGATGRDTSQRASSALPESPPPKNSSSRSRERERVQGRSGAYKREAQSQPMLTGEPEAAAQRLVKRRLRSRSSSPRPEQHQELTPPPTQIRGKSSQKRPGDVNRPNTAANLNRRRPRRANEEDEEDEADFSDSEESFPDEQNSEDSQTEDDERRSESDPDAEGEDELAALAMPVQPNQKSTLARRSNTADGLFDIDDAQVRVIKRQKTMSMASEDYPPSSEESISMKDLSFSSGRSSTSSKRSSVHRPSAEKPPKSSAARVAKFEAERVTISAKPPKVDKRKGRKSSKKAARRDPTDSEEEVSDVDKIDWPAHTKLRGSGLLDQTLEIQKVCQIAIGYTKRDLITKEAWPELHRVPEYLLELLTEATEELEGLAEDPEEAELYDLICQRVTKDEHFSSVLGRWVVDRLAHYRGPFYAHAKSHIALFQLGAGTICIERVSALLQDDLYVYPGEWVTNATGQQKWVAEGSKIYLNGGIIDIIRSAFFEKPTSMGFHYKQYFVSSHPDRNEAEMPISLVALAATAMHCTLDGWKTGRPLLPDKFSGDTYKTVFKRHQQYLTHIREQSINAFHSLMSQIYSQVVGSGTLAHAATTGGNALAVLDLSGFD